MKGKKLKKILRQKNGITLIALVITIIVLLILAGVTIAMLTGNNGILSQAQNAQEQTKTGSEEEKVKLSVTGAIAMNNGGQITRTNLNAELTNYIGTEGIDYTLSESETAPFVVKYLDSGKSYSIDENGNVSEYVDISEYIAIGDYVNYNPTISDKNGTPIEADKLTYTSKTGTGMLHGNGSANQTFTATTDTKWRVLNIENGKVELIPENPISTDEGKNFSMRGAIGYLYAEQELHEICKIYGYGYGADTSQVTRYSYGGPADGDLKGEITGSGARSIIVEDINKKAGISTEDDYRQLDSNYGNTDLPSTEVYYPTINTETGKMNGIKNLKYTHYSYSKSKIKNENIENILFGKNYWQASRCIKSASFPGFGVRNVNSDTVTAYYICNGMPSQLDEVSTSDYGVCPVVTIKPDVIDTSSNTEYNGKIMWNLK